MNQLQAMRVFIRVVDLASFHLAAKQLGMSAAAVTRSVSTLEAHLNMRLINRSTRRFSLTEIGQEYVDGCRNVIAELDNIESNLARTNRDMSGTLRIATSTTFATCGLGNLLSAYRDSFPRINFDVTTYDAAIELIDGGFDIGFSVDRDLPSTTLISRQLTTYREIAVASPSYLARHGTPNTPNSLAGHPLLSPALGNTRVWQFSDNETTYRVSTANALCSPNISTIKSAALADMGIALLPAPFVKEDVARGDLLPILGHYHVAGGPRCVSICYTGRTYLSAKVRHFIDFAVSQYRTPMPNAAHLTVA